MIDFYNGSLFDIIPENFKTYETEALSFSVQRAMQKLQNYAKATAVYSAVAELPDPVLNLLATELRAQYYDTKLPRKTREGIVKNTFAWYLRGGTGSVLEEYLGTLYQGGKITEWFQYGGEPFFFKAVVDLKSDEEIEVGDGIKIIHKINEYKNVRSWLEALMLHVGTSFWVPVSYENAVHIQTAFHPRYNLPYLLLDRTWEFDASCRLNGYASDDVLDFYPVRLWVEAGAEEDIRTGLQIRSAWESPEDVKTESCVCIRNEAVEVVRTGEKVVMQNTVWVEAAAEIWLHTLQKAQVKLLTGCGVCMQSAVEKALQTIERVGIQMESAYHIKTASYMTKMNQLNCEWKLDGSRKLDGGHYIL